MNIVQSLKQIDRNRRRFLSTAAMTVASARLSFFNSTQGGAEVGSEEKVMAGTAAPTGELHSLAVATQFASSKSRYAQRLRRRWRRVRRRCMASRILPSASPHECSTTTRGATSKLLRASMTVR